MRAQPNTMNRIGAWRIYRGLTQSDLARMVGVSAGTIHTWENHKFLPRPMHLTLLCKALRCTVQDLYAEAMGPF